MRLGSFGIPLGCSVSAVFKSYVCYILTGRLRLFFFFFATLPSITVMFEQFEKNTIPLRTEQDYYHNKCGARSQCQCYSIMAKNSGLNVEKLPNYFWKKALREVIFDSLYK